MTECLFCRIVDKEIPAKIVYEDDRVLAFEDLHPQAPVHILIIPKLHIEKVDEIASKEEYNYLGDIFKTINKVAREKYLSESGFRVVVNCGENAGQAVMHLHFHLLGGRAMHWPPG